MRYHLDTNTASYIVRGLSKPRQIAQLRLGRWSISSIVHAELATWLSSPIGAETELALSTFLAQVETENFGAGAALEHGRIQAQAKAVGRPVSAMDSLIAAHAITEGAILVTNNTKHFEHIEGLYLDNWLD